MTRSTKLNIHRLARARKMKITTQSLFLFFEISQLQRDYHLSSSEGSHPILQRNTSITRAVNSSRLFRVSPMDCLTGYGSDSEESSSSSAITNNAEASGSNQVSNTAPLSNLLGAGIDSCSSSSDDEETPPKRTPSHASSSSSKKPLRDDTEIHKHATKKQRTEASNLKGNSFASRNGLPSPQITHKASMISWTKDHLSKEQPDDSIPTRRKFEKFQQLATLQSYDATKGWAAHIRTQNEFHNPHYLQSVIEQFGIAESLGSRAASTKIKQSRFQ